MVWTGAVTAGLAVTYHCPDGVGGDLARPRPALPLSDLAIDAHGRSGDLLVTVSRGPARATWVVSGLSGAWFAPAPGVVPP